MHWTQGLKTRLRETAHYSQLRAKVKRNFIIDPLDSHPFRNEAGEGDPSLTALANPNPDKALFSRGGGTRPPYPMVWG